MVVSNLRYRRSRSAGVGWVDHQPGPNEPPIVTKSTIMTPSTKGREIKTIRGCPSDKDLKSPKASRYSLTRQSQEVDGTLKTEIYKVSYLEYAGRGVDTKNLIMTSNNTLKLYYQYRVISFLPQLADDKLFLTMSKLSHNVLPLTIDEQGVDRLKRLSESQNVVTKKSSKTKRLEWEV